MAIDKEKGIRLELFVNSLNIKHKAFAARVGTSNKFVSQIINGHSNLTTDMAYRIGKAYPELNKEWLLKGEGEMLIVEKQPDMVEEKQPMYGGDPLDGLRQMLEKHEQEIKELRREVEGLKKRL